MLTGFAATADLRGGRIDVGWTWSGLGDRPELRLLRRLEAHPVDAYDGAALLDLGTLFRTPTEPWGRIAEVRYGWTGGGTGALVAQAAVMLFYAAAESEPSAVDVAVYEPSTGGLAVTRVAEVSRVESSLPPPAPWGRIEMLELFHTPGGGPEESAGTVTVLRDHDDGVTASLFRWEPAAGPPVEHAIAVGEVLHVGSALDVQTATELAAAWHRSVRLDSWDLEAVLVDPSMLDADDVADDAAVTLAESFSPDSGDWTRTLSVSDGRPAPERASYYRLFQGDALDATAWSSEREWQAHATASARYGFPERAYGMLPSVHQFYDEPTPEARGTGQLRRFLEVFGVALDHLRSGGEALRSRHDVAAVRGDFLPALGGWIGWPTDRTEPLPIQRSDIRMAPDVYRTVGTLPNIATLARRATGWPCEAKEFVHNLFMTNAPEYVPVRELRTASYDGAAFSGPEVLTSVEDRFDGRPAPVLDGSGERWLFWHSDRSGRWEIWHTRPDGSGGTTEPGPLDAPGADEPKPNYHDVAPTVARYTPGGADELWLAWESDREGAVDIWCRVHDGAAWGDPFRITDHPAEDRRPALAAGVGDALSLFWESERRGRSEIWSTSHTGGAWEPAIRLTESLGQDKEPTSAVDASGRTWLVWRRDEADRSRLFSKIRTGTTWSPETALEDGPWRDESPFLARRGGELWLLWHSDRTGRWELWARVHDGVSWGDPVQVTQGPNADKEPVLLVDGVDAQLFWRSEHPSERFRSKTVDTADLELLRARGRLQDRIHYTYDTARGDLDWYARDVVGVYVTPPRGTPTEVVDDVIERAETYLEPFRPATVRLVVLPDRGVGTTDFHADGLGLDTPIGDDFVDDIE